MAIKNRLLSKLKSTCVLMNMAAISHPQKMHPVYRKLVEARELCQQGLTESNFAKYAEVYDGVIMAVKQVLDGGVGSDTQEIVGLCQELLQHIMVETSKEEHFKKEMVFLPYKYSMWDSLESVWRAAYEDKDNCLAYVIPIPYCDRNPDGTAKEWHCEREFFPADIPTLDWQEVDLKVMHPDVIFFHYPYDNCNRVTSPSQEYYSSNLKMCTDKLVYIPYFVTGKTVKPNFIQEPGVNNADYVIVENEKIKAIYEEYYSVGELPEGKILALGSPKYDKVIAARKEEYPLPEAWERLIAGRKIILYNTSLQAHLVHSDKILEKLYSVLLYFKERKDLAFWWRPHPLMEATLDSMLPHVASVYREVRDAYVKEGWGIYDDTPEMERAIVWSDAYYGDTSSMVELYSKTGKPIMIQDMEVKNIKLG